MILSRILDVRAHGAAVGEASRLTSERAALLRAMTWRDLVDRYAGQAFGAAWAIISPIMLMATYIVAFGLIFRGRLGSVDDGTAYITFMLAGLLPWMMIQDCLSRAPTAVTGQANLVKQIVFPSELLPMRVALSSLPVLAIGLLFAIPLAIWSGAWTPAGLLLKLPMAVVLLLVMLLGIAFWLAAIGVFARDLKDLVTALLGIGLFLHPVLYPPASVPAWLEPVFLASPFSYVIWCFRDALSTAAPGQLWHWVTFAGLSVLAFTTGWRVYRMLKPTFGNAL